MRETPTEPSSRLEDEGQELLSNDFTLEPEDDEVGPYDDIDFDQVIDDDEEIPLLVQQSGTLTTSSDTSSTNAEAMTMPSEPEKVTIDQKFVEDIKILTDVLKFVQEKRKDAKYSLSFLNSTETAAKKCLRDIYKGNK